MTDGLRPCQGYLPARLSRNVPNLAVNPSCNNEGWLSRCLAPSWLDLRCQGRGVRKRGQGGEPEGLEV